MADNNISLNDLNATLALGIITRSDVTKLIGTVRANGLPPDSAASAQQIRSAFEVSADKFEGGANGPAYEQYLAFFKHFPRDGEPGTTFDGAMSALSGNPPIGPGTSASLGRLYDAVTCSAPLTKDQMQQLFDLKNRLQPPGAPLSIYAAQVNEIIIAANNISALPPVSIPNPA
jgi:hypothetical protein